MGRAITLFYPLVCSFKTGESHLPAISRLYFQDFKEGGEVKNQAKGKGKVTIWENGGASEVSELVLIGDLKRM